MNSDNEHLNLLAVFYYITAGLSALAACVPGLYVIFGIVAMVFGGVIAQETNGDPLPTAIPMMAGGMFMVFGLILMAIGFAMAYLSYLVGKYLNNRTHRTFCIVMAALFCSSFPFGTILGVFTLIVLCRDSVRDMFDGPTVVVTN